MRYLVGDINDRIEDPAMENLDDAHSNFIADLEKQCTRSRRKADIFEHYTDNSGFYPLEGYFSHTYSSVNTVELTKLLCVGGKNCFKLKNTLYYRMYIYDQGKLFKSATHLCSGESFALRTTGYGVGNPPLYLKYYKRAGDSQSSSLHGANRMRTQSSLLSTPIDDLFRILMDRRVQAENKSIQEDLGNGQKMVWRKRRAKNREKEKREPWAIRYRPRYFSDLLTDESVNIECLEWLARWNCCVKVPCEKIDENEKQILLLGGPAGVGKTTLVYVLAAHCGFNVVEVNASDNRTKNRIMPIINGVISANSISSEKPNLCLLEEVDGLAQGETQVIGAIKELANKRTKNGHAYIKRPIVCTCNDVYAQHLRELREVSKIVFVDSCDPTVLQQRLERILDNEGFYVDMETLRSVQTMYNNDIRSCLSGLEFLTSCADEAIEDDILRLLSLYKDHSEGIKQLLKLLFSGGVEDSKYSHLMDKIFSRLTEVANAVGYQTCVSLLVENVFNLSHRSGNLSGKLSVFLDLIVQGDLMEQSERLQVLNIACRFMFKYIRNNNSSSCMLQRLIYPAKLVQQQFAQRWQRCRSALHSIRSNSSMHIVTDTISPTFGAEVLPYILQQLLSSCTTSLTWSSVSKIVKGVDLIWELFGPLGEAKLKLYMLRLLKVANLLIIYGIRITKVADVYVFDPPILDLSLNDTLLAKSGYFNNAIQEEVLKGHKNPPNQEYMTILMNLVQILLSLQDLENERLQDPQQRFKGHKELNSISKTIKLIISEGFDLFINIYKTENDRIANSSELTNNKRALNEEEEIQVKLCRLIDRNIEALTFTQIMEQESLGLSEISTHLMGNGAKKHKAHARTCGNFRFQDQNCSAVRYIISSLD